MNKLFVAAIGVVLGGIVVVKQTGIADGYTSTADREDLNRVEVQLHKVQMALHQYNSDLGEIPTGFSDLVNYGLLKQSDLQDPWGHELAYRSERRKTSAHKEEYEIFIYSKGPDGIQDNKDDIYI